MALTLKSHESSISSLQSDNGWSSYPQLLALDEEGDWVLTTQSEGKTPLTDLQMVEYLVTREAGPR